jgi:hypothetical protein
LFWDLLAPKSLHPRRAQSIELLPDMNPLLKEIRHDPVLWLLVFVPVVFAAANFKPAAHTLLFILSVPGHRASGGAAESRY